MRRRSAPPDHNPQVGGDHCGQGNEPLDRAVGGDQECAERENQQPDDLGCSLTLIGAPVVAFDHDHRHLILPTALSSDVVHDLVRQRRVVIGKAGECLDHRRNDELDLLVDLIERNLRGGGVGLLGLVRCQVAAGALIPFGHSLISGRRRAATLLALAPYRSQLFNTDT